MTLEFRPAQRAVVVLTPVLAWAACSSGGTGPSTSDNANCDTPAAIVLSVGEYTVADPASSNGCVRIPAGSAESEYLLALISGAGDVTTSGVSGPYAVRAGLQGTVTAASAALPAPRPSRMAKPPGAAQAFDRALRERERALSAVPGNRIAAPRAPGQAVPPVLGSEATFNVCKTTKCDTFDQVTAVVKSVGIHVAILLDKTVPDNDPLQQSDLDDLARTFDTYHYPIDQNAFGNESDLDANGVVLILLTDAVNALTPDCTDGRILGYFYGGDLLNITGSNHGEVFYAMVPSPKVGNCEAVGRAAMLARLKPTLIHEFQHMISFNQHYLLRGAPSEVTWLNEGLSHFAEELGGQLIPGVECPGFPGDHPCRSQYTSGDLFNAYDYLTDTESQFLVFPSGSTGSLEERGASWLFVRWLADQFGTDSTGSNTTRALVQTQLQGAANVGAVTGEAFENLVSEWMLAVYLDDLDGFIPLSTRLRYSSWGFRFVFANNCCQQGSPFAQAFPFTPVNASVFPFSRSGTLRGGSGRHFSLVVPAGSQSADVLVARAIGGLPLDPALTARLAVVRIR